MRRHLCLLTILGYLFSASQPHAQVPGQPAIQIVNNLPGPAASPQTGWQVFFGVLGGGVIAALFTAGASVLTKKMELDHQKHNLAVQLAVAGYKIQIECDKANHDNDLLRRGFQPSERPFVPAPIEFKVRDILHSMEQFKQQKDSPVSIRWSIFKSATKKRYQRVSESVTRLFKRLWFGWDNV